jgi:ferredoxin-NADP reductase
MPVHETRLLRRKQVGANTMAFWLEKPAGFVFRAGQNALLSLIDPVEADPYGTNRPFSLASAPHERELMVVTRMRNTAFKRYLAAAPLGSGMRLEGPRGEMVLHDDPIRPAIFIAWGIGITPFRSMALDAAERQLAHRIWLFHSSRRPEDAAFFAELGQLEDRNPSYRFIPTVTAASVSSKGWSGETRPVGPPLLRKWLPDVRSPIYYFAGPPGMTTEIQLMLADLGIPPQDMFSEDFYGY